MEGLLNVLKDLQGVIQRGLTNFKKCPKDRLCIEYIETRQELLEKDWALFKDNYIKVQGQHKVPDVSKLVEMYDCTEDTYITYKSLIKTMLKKYGTSTEVVQVGNSSVPTSKNCFIKLPKIEIPTFTGKYAEWTTFRDLFTSLVHNNKNLDNVQKMHYLKSHLSGEAEQLVRYTPVTESNYIQCWSQLEKRYNNKKYLVNCILKRLFGQKRMSIESATSLKELLDTTNDCLSALSNLDVNVTTWDVIIIHIVSFKLDTETRKQWELHVSSNDSNDLPTFNQFCSFIENRFRALECIEPKRVSTHQVNSSHGLKTMVAVSSNSMRCEYCSEGHKLCFCKAFVKQSVLQRREFVGKHKLCFNCLGSNHGVASCQKPSTCKICKKRHHSLLHISEFVNKNNNTTHTHGSPMNVDSSSSVSGTTPVVSCFSKALRIPRQVLLATALVKAQSKAGNFQVVRALIDQGSQACLVTEATVQYLRLPKIPVRGIVSGLGHQSSLSKYMVRLKLQSQVDQTIELNIDAYVLSRITSHLPERGMNRDAFDWLNIAPKDLADPEFYNPNRIDILLGAEVYSCILKEPMLKGPSGTLIAQSTTLGWILSGAVCNQNSDRSNITPRCINVMHTQFKEDELLKKFWEVEEQQPNLKNLLTPEELRCEEFYKATTTRREDGRYVVKLPFRTEDPLCKAGSSRMIAETRFRTLEKRLEKNSDLKVKYSQVINEYLELGHMKPVQKMDTMRDIAVYLPHHAVVREDKTTTKVRVVFNASEKNKNGVSLNDTLMIGPTLQADLRHIVLKWRVHQIGIVADIIKMYRQIGVAEEDTLFQRILWRDHPEKEISDYELVTVTFGTASAPFQAVRTLHQLAYDEGEAYPLATDTVLNCFYMDDLMTGCSSIEEGIEVYTQMVGLLEKGGFTLQKWNSNNQVMFDKIQSMERDRARIRSTDKDIQTECDKEGINIKLDSTMKILGLTWNRNKDCFQYTLNLPSMKATPITKRIIISDIARLFDPLGWLSPTVVMAKMLIQRLWLTGLGWDEPLSNEIVSEWITYREELLTLTKIQIPRWYGMGADDDVELHGFCDASKSAYAAVVYIRRIDDTGNVYVSLVAAKSRVAPIKQISIPRLELSGAVLLSRLLIEVSDILNIQKHKVKAWTDSTIVLAWLSSHPGKWKTFVANRTSEILGVMDASQWFHVSTKENPADCASRGVSPNLLVQTKLWFSGPQFLKESVIVYKRPKDLPITLEQSVKTHIATVAKESDIFERFSTLKRLLRVIAYCRRFIQVRTEKKTYLQSIEIESALVCCIKRTQAQMFVAELTELKDKGYVNSRTSKLKSLCPYLDGKGIMRVRGRLEKAPIDELMKHPIILPNSTHFTHLIILDAHHRTMHGGPQLMTNYLRATYWIIGLRNLVKRCVRNCVVCTRQRAKTNNPMMGSLPSIRCSPARPFLHTGVDYAGPISIRTTKGRGYRAYKGYICVFVCMVTRAIHLEVVSDMSSQAFLAAFRRFISRRGHCAKLWSDNGTTFVGAARELQELSALQHAVAEQLEANGTEWHFIPPHAPNFGGLWEAGVKSTKYHLKRVVGDSTLTYEELSTFLCQVEACLNSRPISVINLDDPGEPMPLTPGHFLIGEPLLTVPDYNYETSSVTSLTRWQLVQRMMQSFWRRWSKEYLSNLMNRYKWSSKSPEPSLGDVVLIKEDDLPPSRWSLGRIIEKHPGNDDVTRVVTLRTKSSIIKRPINKLCVLPIAT